MKAKWFLLYLIIIYGVESASVRAQQPQGIDVSHHQGSINWQLVYNSGKVFAFVKATEGYTYDDPRFTANMQNGKNAGMLMGAYHFARPDNNSPEDEADHFVQVAGPYIGDGYLPPVLDLEDPPGKDLKNLFTSQQLTRWVQTWMERVEQLTGVRPILYTNRRYTTWLQPSLTVYKLWIAEPDDNTDPPDNLGIWPDWAFKQFSWTGNVPGIAGDVDLDIFNGTYEELEAMAYPAGRWTCDDASPIGCGQLLFVPSTQDTSRVNTYACIDAEEPGPERIHTFSLTQRRNISVILSNYYGDLDAFILRSCDSTDCIGTVYESHTVTSFIALGKKYYIVVDSKDGSGSSYDIFIHCYPLYPKEDISLNNAYVTSGDTVRAGEEIAVRVNTYHAGRLDTLETVTTGFFLSEDERFSPEDIPLGENTVHINVNSQSFYSARLQIPASVPPGAYHLLFVADPNNLIDEATEGNNFMSVPLYVEPQIKVEENLLTHTRIYPNPADDEVFIVPPASVQLKNISLYDISGKLLRQFSSTVHPSPYQISVSSLRPGIYLLKITADNGQTATYKLIKK